MFGEAEYPIIATTKIDAAPKIFLYTIILFHLQAWIIHRPTDSKWKISGFLTSSSVDISLEAISPKLK